MTTNEQTNATITASGRFKEAFYTWCENTIEAVQRHPLLAAVGTVLGLAATIATVVSATQLVWSYEIMREERIERAWDRLLQQLPGNSGKAKSLTLLIGEGENIGSIDISCRAIGAWEPSRGICVGPSVFSGFTLSATSGRRPHVQAAHRLGLLDPTPIPDFSGQIIESADLTGISPSGDWATNTRFHDVNLYGARIDWDFGPRLWIVGSDLTNATVNVAALEHLDENNLSNAVIFSQESEMPVPVSRLRKRETAESMSAESMTQRNWFWADRAPIVIQDFYGNPNLVDVGRFKELVKENFDVCDPDRRLPLTRAHQGYNSTMPELGELLPNSIENSKIMRHLRARALGVSAEQNLFEAAQKQCRTISIDQALSRFGKSYEARRSSELSAILKLRVVLRNNN
ncbi:MAG: hypothetical protein KL863_15690 [Rhizobium sp.]|nr:hypothetical protein [Rhizobium sp.]